MNILFVNRKDWRENIGGDSVQMIKVKKYIEGKANVSIETHPRKVRKTISDYDLIHIFNTQRISETLYFCQIANDSNKPLVLSPIYYDLSIVEENISNNLYAFLKSLLKDRIYFLKDLLRVWKRVSYSNFLYLSFLYDFKSMYKKVINLVDVIIPNSFAEKHFLQESFNIEDEKLKVIPNGVDGELLKINYGAMDFIKDFRIPFEKFILCVARIDERKNILNLLNAMIGLDIPLVLIGRYSPLHKHYYNRCRKIIESGKNIIHINESLPQDKLVGAYKACHAHVLPSWVETPGLVNLEAGLFGANLVLSRCPPVEEYFGDRAIYFSPDNVDELRQAIKKAWELPRDAFGLSEYIKKNYLWEKIADQYLKVYTEIL